MRLRLWSLFRHAPRFIRELPYLCCYLILKTAFALRLPAVEIGYRNSLALNRIEPFLSDLDITLVCQFKDRQAAIDLFSRIKFWLPVIGELNIYTRETMQPILAQMNRFERARDPKFALIELTTASIEDEAEKIVFAIRMLEADWTGLLTRPSTRQKKWRGHFEDLGWARPEKMDRAGVLQKLLDFAGFDGFSDILTSVIEDFRAGRPLHLNPNLNHPSVQTLLFHRACFTKPSPQLREKDWAVIRAQKNWETWALHVVPTLDPVSVAHHTLNMENFSKAGLA